MPKKKLIPILIITQILLTWISISRDVEITDTFSIIGMPFLVASWAMLTGIITAFLNKKNMADFVSYFIFLAVSASNILGLLYIIIGVISDGALNESGLIFVAFPAVGFFAIIGGAILGSIVYLVKKRKK